MCSFFANNVKTIGRHLRIKFLGTHQSSDFNYVLQPFFFIFKVFGLMPFKLKHKNGAILDAHLDVTACLATLLGIICCTVGFSCGVADLMHREISLKLRESSIISYFTTWAQIFTLFGLGSVALLTTWSHIRSMHTLCNLIFSIDDALRQFGEITICYRVLRRRLFVFLAMAMFVPVVLSMVNCIVIQPMSNIFTWNSPCYWFICFAPILILTLKEFKFFNLMFILKGKLALVNKELHSYASGSRFVEVQNVDSVPEIPLTALVVDSRGSEKPPTVQNLKQLLAIYSNISDGIELLLNIFSIHLVLMTTASLVIITIQTYNLFALLVHSLDMSTHHVVITVAWILVQIMVTGIKVIACSSTAKTMSHTGNILHKIQVMSADTDSIMLYQVLQIFSLEVLQRKNCFTAAGYFNMDNKLITSIIAAVTTYLVIIIQFHLSNIPNKWSSNITTVATTTIN